VNSALIVALATALLPGFVFFTAVYTIIIKVLEKRLTFTKSLLISSVACGSSLIYLHRYVTVAMGGHFGSKTELYTH